MEEFSPVRVVMDSRLTTALTARVAATASKHPTWLVTCEGVAKNRLEAFANCGVEIITVAPDDVGRPDVVATLGELGKRGITRVMVEGGPQISATFFRAGLVDRLAWFRAPDVIGGDGLPAIEGFGVDRLAEKVPFTRVRTFPIGRDVLEIFERAGARENKGGKV